MKSLVELHGGEVTAHSDGAGGGSTFVVRLPRAKEGSEVVKAPLVPQKEIDPSLPPTVALLVIDDNEDAADILGMLLRNEGYSVTVAYSSSDALAEAQRAAPAVVFLDIGLPDMDGYMLARKLREMPETKEAFLVALTGYVQPEDVQRAVAAGFDRHLVKPVTLPIIFELVNQAILKV